MRAGRDVVAVGDAKRSARPSRRAPNDTANAQQVDAYDRARHSEKYVGGACARTSLPVSRLANAANGDCGTATGRIGCRPVAVFCVRHGDEIAAARPVPSRRPSRSRHLSRAAGARRRCLQFRTHKPRKRTLCVQSCRHEATLSAVSDKCPPTSASERLSWRI